MNFITIHTTLLVWLHSHTHNPLLNIFFSHLEHKTYLMWYKKKHSWFVKVLKTSIILLKTMICIATSYFFHSEYRIWNAINKTILSFIALFNGKTYGKSQPFTSCIARGMNFITRQWYDLHLKNWQLWLFCKHCEVCRCVHYIVIPP